jgi:cysteine desulfurase
MIYLDNSSTTPIDPEVFEAMKPYLMEEYGNPSNKYYLKAENAKKAVEEARARLAALIKANPEEIIFTSGASESNNFIIKGVADYKRNIEGKGNHIITSKAEHKSVLQTCKFLNGEVYMNIERKKSFNAPPLKVDRGYEVTFLGTNEYGQVEPEALCSAIKENTVLVSLMWGNNEIGTISDIPSLTKVCKDKGVLFHSDATQVLGKVDIDVTDVPVDFLSFSAHKIYGPKGIGACYIRKGKYTLPDITSLIHGGLQEFGYRSGTHSVHNIVGFGKAAEIAQRNMKNYITKLNELELELKKALSQKIKGVEFLGHPQDHIPGVLSVIIPNKNNELFIKRISDEVAVSTGSACSIGEPSYVLEAIGKGQFTSNVVRISLNKFHGEEDVREFIELIR